MTEQTKKCPMCAENIPVTATVCPYCNASLQERPPAPPASPPQPAAAFPPQPVTPAALPGRSPNRAGLAIVVILIILVIGAGAVYLLGTAGVIQLPFAAPTATPVNWECFSQQVSDYAEIANPLVERGTQVINEATEDIRNHDFAALNVHAIDMWDVVHDFDNVTPPHLYLTYHREEGLMMRRFAESLDALVRGDIDTATDLMNESVVHGESARAAVNQIDEFCITP